MSGATRRPLDLPGGRDLHLLAVVGLAELLLVSGYFALTPADVTNVGYALVPFVWIDVGLWAVLRTDPPAATAGQRWGAVAVAGVYFFVLAWLAGLVGVVTDVEPFARGLRVGLGSPGWERIVYVAPPVYVSLVPYRVLGYLGLAYLVYVTVLETARNLLAGTLGLLSCLSCSFPIVASLLAGVAGGSAGLTAVYAHSVELSTVVFVAAVGLLYWRPTVADLRTLVR